MNTWPEHYLGLPWKLGGRSMTGLDCWGLLRFIYGVQFGITLSEHPVSGKLADADMVVQEELGAHCWVPIISPQVGDVVALGKGAGLCHVGVYVETPAPSILHIAADCPSVIVGLKLLYRKGYQNVKYYRHVERDPNN